MNDLFESVIDVVKEGMKENTIGTLIALVGVTTIYAILKSK